MDQEVAKTLGELEIKLQELERELTTIGKRDAQPSKLRAPGKLVDEAVEGQEATPGTAGPHAGTGATPGQYAGTGATAGQYAGTGAQAGANPGTAIANAWQQTAAETAGAQPHYAGGTGAGLDEEQARAVDNAFGGPAVFGGEELPAQPTLGAGSAFPVSETAYGEIATDSPQPTTAFPTGVFSPAAAETPGTPPPGPPLPPPGPPPPGPAPAPPIPTPQPPPPQPIDRVELVRFKEKLQRTMEDLVDEYGKLLLPKPPA